MQARPSNRTASAAKSRRPRYVVYPESNGRPIAETQLHLDRLLRALVILEDRGADDPLFFVAADLFLYYEEGNPAACVAPDLFVAKGVPKRPLRNVYKLWEEKLPPCFVLELTSPSTAREDQRKLAVYERLEVAESFLYDPRPLIRRRTPELQGFRLVAGRYGPVPLEAGGGLLSEELGLKLIVENGRLELYDSRTGQRLLHRQEQLAASELRASAAEQRAEAAEARAAALEAQLRGSP